MRIYLNRNWNFAGKSVDIPHTVKETPFHYFDESEYQMVSTYQKEIDVPNEWKGKQVLLTFEGVAHVCEVFLNGEKIGEHRCGYTAFTVNLKNLIYGEKNNLLVKVNSREDLNVPPFGHVIDYMTYGGIYRDVVFIEVENCHFDLLKDGTESVFVTPHCSGKTRLDVFPVDMDENTIVTIELKDAKGNIVGSAGAKATEHMDFIIDVKEPHLWDGMAEPYLYTSVAKLVQGETVVDTVEVSYGYRSFRVDVETGFWLNGKNVPLRGVS